MHHELIMIFLIPLVGGLVANECESSRRRRLKSVLRSYIGFDESNLDVRITAEDGCEWGTMEPDTYDKVFCYTI